MRHASCLVLTCVATRQRKLAQTTGPCFRKSPTTNMGTQCEAKFTRRRDRPRAPHPATNSIPPRRPRVCNIAFPETLHLDMLAHSPRFWLAATLLALTAIANTASAQPRESRRGDTREAPPGPHADISTLVGRPTTTTAAISVLSARALEGYITYTVNNTRKQTATKSLAANTPTEFELTGLLPNTRYTYQLHTRYTTTKTTDFTAHDPATFHTARPAGSTFTFGVQGDSHPERMGRMFDPDLYTRALNNARGDNLAFYFMMGDDFSIERLIERNTKSQQAVDAIYAHQRTYLATIGASTPLMLVNGNHEQAAKYLLDGTPTNFAVFAANARTRFYPLPDPAARPPFYTGNTNPVEHIGLLRDYYAWTWGDALFVVIDPYWHSEVAVDNEAGTKAPPRDQQGQPVREGGRRNRQTDKAPADPSQPDTSTTKQPGGRGARDLWQITLGDDQYNWLRTTLRSSNAKFKFVFSHHVLGTGRGGIEQATKYEWGGDDRRGIDRFREMRPTWDQPIHDLLRDTGVTIFFQGHDHLYAKQELDGVIYQTVPNPADPTFTAFNKEAYKSGEILPNSGHLRVTVSPDSTKVEYVQAFRDSDESPANKNAAIAATYTLTPRPNRAASPDQPASSSELTPKDNK